MPGARELDDWVKRKLAARNERKRIRDVTKRIIPDTFQQQILDAAAQERAAVLARLEVIDASIETLGRHKKAASAARMETIYFPPPPTRIKRNLFGEVYEVPCRGGRGQVTQETVEANQTLHRIDNHLKALKAERMFRLSELREIRVVERQTRAGIVTGLLHMTANWRNRVDVGVLLPRAKLGGSVREYSDRFGNPLPPEALDANGEPDLPSTRVPK